MTASFALACAALLAVPLAGLPYARALGLRSALLPVASWLVGAGLLAYGMLALSVAHVRFSRASLAMLWLLLVLIGMSLWLWSSRRLRPRVSRREQLPSAPITVALAVCAFQVLYVWLVSVRVPLGSFDAWALWDYKGRRFWLDAAVSNSTLHDHAMIFAHPAYPPLLPLMIAWVYTFIGSADPALMKPLFPIFYAALLASFFSALRLRTSVAVAALGAVALALLPRLADYAGTGMADVPLYAYVVAAVAAYGAFTSTRDPRALFASGILMGFALLTKHDGLPYLVCGVAAAGLADRRWAGALTGAAVALATCAPWYLYIHFSAIPDRDFLPATLGNFTAHADRLAPIARLFTLNLLSVDEWSVLWYAFGVTLLLAVLRKRVHAPALLLLVVAPLVMYVVSLSLSAWPDYMLHTRTSLDRLIMGTTPFALWFVLEQILPGSREERC